MRAQDFVTTDAGHAGHAEDMSGVRGSVQGMAPYPLYGLPQGLGQEEPTVAFYKRPWFCWTGGIVVGLVGGFFIGQATASLGMLLLQSMKKNSKKRARKAKQLAAGEAA
jgi:hypothetical protein